MFGYIIVNKDELKFKEFDIYRAYYCGLCKVLKDKYGIKGQVTLSYDMTFLALLLSDLYEPEIKKDCVNCAMHPFEKHNTLTSPYTEYAAQMNILLTYYKCLDDWNDDRSLKKKALGSMLKCSVERIYLEYPNKAKLIRDKMNEIGKNEHAGVTDIDVMSGLFGDILGEIFAYRDDEWQDELRKIGSYLGRFIYIMDAYEDMEEDRKKNRYNPLLDKAEDADFEDNIQKVLSMMMSECSKAFELLPIINDIEILRNILYSGVWTRYEMVKAKRAGKEDSNA